jgi:hypothetical protein
MKAAFKTLIFVGFLVLILGVDFVGETPSRVVYVRDAEAIIGLPFTPLSFAGVARRTAFRRAAWATTTAVAATSVAAASAASASAAAAAAAAPHETTVVVTQAPPPAPAASGVPVGTVVQALPAGCTSVVVGGVDYSDCGGTFYKAAFQGNNLVYVVVQNPLK